MKNLGTKKDSIQETNKLVKERKEKEKKNNRNKLNGNRSLEEGKLLILSLLITYRVLLGWQF